MKNQYVVPKHLYLLAFAALSLGLLVVLVADRFSTRPTWASHTTFGKGDVFAAVGDGKVNWYHPDGTLNQVLDTGLGSETTGMAFDAAGNLYVTTFSAGTVSKFDNSGNLLGTFGTGYSGRPESTVFDAAGNVYVGAVDGDNDIRKFDAAGNLLAKFDVATEDRGSDWIDLAADQCMMFYTSEGTTIKRFDVCTNTQLADFASGLHGPAYALRILPDGGVVVADNVDIHRLDSRGTIAHTYDARGEDCWFALNRDPDGRSFWSGGLCKGNFYKFDIATGNILLGPIHACTSMGCLGGLAIFGELTEAVPSVGPVVPQRWWWLLIPALLLPLLGAIWWRRRRPSPRAVARPDVRRPPVAPVTPVEKKRREEPGADVTHGRPRKR